MELVDYTLFSGGGSPILSPLKVKRKEKKEGCVCAVLRVDFFVFFFSGPILEKERQQPYIYIERERERETRISSTSR